jgi:hypothetical protein
MKIFDRRASKKGSLSLSINAVVILVLAITMLGLGLGFTKGMFGKFKEKLTVPEPPSPATADETIVLPTGDVLDLRIGRDAEITVNFYNDYVSKTWKPYLDCGENPEGEEIVGLSSLTGDIGVSQRVESASQASFKIILETSDIKLEAKEVCKIVFYEEGGDPESADTIKVEKQIIIGLN